MRMCEAEGCEQPSRSGHSRFCEPHSEHRHTAAQFQSNGSVAKLRDNTLTDDDLELDRLKAERDEAVRLLEAERAERQAADHEAEALRANLQRHMTEVEFLDGEIQKAHEATCDREFDETAPDEVKLTSRRQGNETAVDALVREHQEFIKRGWSQAIHEEWGVGDFCGPCAHGRDPYTRCDECEDLTPREALERALLAPVIIERDAARAELAATKAGADHLRTSLQRANARIDELTRPLSTPDDARPYEVADVYEIEAARGKPYARLAATVRERDALRERIAEAVAKLGGGQ